MYADMLEEDLRGIEKIRKCSDFAEMYDAADRFVWKTLSRKKDDSVSAEKRESVERTGKKGDCRGEGNLFLRAGKRMERGHGFGGRVCENARIFGKAVRRKVCGKEARQKYDRF